MKIILWDLPEQQITYLRENCKEQFETEVICALEREEEARTLFALIRKGDVALKELLLISQNKSILSEAIVAGAAVIAYQAPEAEPFYLKADMLVEGFEEVDYNFLEKVYQRHYGIPWEILETERLRVRELTLADMDALFELYSYEGMTDYMEDLYPYEEEYRYQESYIENMYRFFGYGMWLVFEKDTGKLVGRAGVEHREELEGELELGYAIGTPWQGQGFATEVCEGILAYTKEKLGFEEICSLVEPENKKSIHLLEKLGFILSEELVIDDMTYKKYKKVL